MNSGLSTSPPSWVKGMIVCLLSLPSNLEAEPFAELTFKAKSYALRPDHKEQLAALIAEAKANPKVVIQIAERTQGLKATSLPHIAERDRSLLIFQELVREGVDPARIQYQAVKPTAALDTLSVKAIVDENAPSTPKVVPTETGVGAGANEFVINFPSASAVPGNLDETRFQSFIKSVGQPGHDAVVIEGYTDTVGNAAYNQALGDLRALSVYERLTRAGLPPYRVDTQSRGASAAKVKGDSASDRRVVVRWLVSATIAAVAAKEEAKPPAPAVEEPKAVVAPKLEEPVKVEAVPPPAPSPGPSPIKRSLFDIVPFVGLAIPVGEFKNHAKKGAFYGLGLGKDFWTCPQGELRVTVFIGATRLDAKEDDRSGPIKITAVDARADFVFGQGASQPFVGIGPGLYKWNGAIEQKSTSLNHENDRRDSGLLVAGGLDYFLLPNLMFEPTLEWNSVGGEFNENFLDAKLALRWRL